MNNETENRLWDYCDGLLDRQEEVAFELELKSNSGLRARVQEIRGLSKMLAESGQANLAEDFTIRVLQAWESESKIPMLEPVKPISWGLWLIVVPFSLLLAGAIYLIVASVLSEPGDFTALANTGESELGKFLHSRMLYRAELLAAVLLPLGIFDFLLRRMKTSTGRV